tara:strand:- start:1085 stop:1420 length:336 start_codon:yes stop_codon:yes gene_type:complete
MADTQEVKKQEAVAPSPDQAVAPQLTIADLTQLLNIIDAASSRGAFRANELTNVGSVVDKLSKFLQYVTDQQKAEAEAKAKAEGGSVDAGTVSGTDASAGAGSSESEASKK